MRIGLSGSSIRDEKRTPTAKSYIQDGLVAMWDGIENAGWGIHDDNADSWLELISNTDCPYVSASTCSWGNDCFISKRDEGYFEAFYPGGLQYTHTLQFVALKIDSSRGCICGSYKIGNNCNIEYIDGNCRWYYNGNPDTSCPMFFLNTILSYSCVHCLNKYTFYRNDILLGDNENSMNYLSASRMLINRDNRSVMCLAGNIYSIRFYNRSLTASEISYNYRIDKSRFNLP